MNNMSREIDENESKKYSMDDLYWNAVATKQDGWCFGDVEIEVGLAADTSSLRIWRYLDHEPCTNNMMRELALFYRLTVPSCS